MGEVTVIAGALDTHCPPAAQNRGLRSEAVSLIWYLSSMRRALAEACTKETTRQKPICIRGAVEIDGKLVTSPPRLLPRLYS